MDFKKPLSLVLTIVYLSTQVAFGSLAESNVWAERRKATHDDAGGPKSQQLAFLAAGAAARSGSLINQLPTVTAALPTLSQWGQLDRKKYAHLSPTIQSLISAIPLLSGTIQDVYDVPAQDSSPVLLIQDVHMNSEAQANIAAILQAVIDEKQVDVVGVEGAFRPFPLKPFRELSDRKLVKTVADSLLQHNLLAAPSYVGITSEVSPPAFFGIDDPAHYQANVRAYLDSRTSKDRVVRELAVEKARLVEQKRQNFSSALQHFDDLRSAHLAGKLSLGSYLKTLASYRLETDFVIDQFLAALEMENHLDFKKVEQERKSVIEKLTRSLTEQETSDLLAESVAYRMGKIGFGGYYQGLKDLCQKKGVNLRNTPAFENYIRYVLLSDGIKAEELFQSLNKLEQTVQSSLVRSPMEQRLAALSERISLSEKLIEFSLTPDEWKRYRELRAAEA